MKNINQKNKKNNFYIQYYYMNNIGILDVSGINLNPLNNKPYSDTYKNLAEIWSKFPAYEKAESIIKDISENQVTLVISGTGSGKTVLLPKFAMHVLNYDKKIAITLPKQLIAKSAAEFAAKTLDVELGDIVGYQYKGSDKSAKTNNTKLLYATDGTIVSRLLKDPLLSEFNAVIIDEAHERKVQIDFLLYLLKNTLYNRPEFKLIIMSATINEDIFVKYFTDFKFTTINVGAKTNYPIESIFLENETNNYLDEGYKILKEIIKKDDLSKKDESHDILFFITSSNEARKICLKVAQDEDIMQDNYCIEVYSGMDNRKQEIATDKDKYKELYNKKRKIVLATNVAESSLTIDGIKYVIDSGLEFNSYFEPEYNAKVLNKILITHAQAKQRMGRAGRTESGYCYHLYTKQQFDNMKKFPEPTIRTSNIIDECLKFLAIESIKSLDNLINIFTKFIEPPREKYIYYAFNDLKRLKLVNSDKKDNSISELGLLVNNLNFDIYLTYACIIAKKLNCLNEVLSICCLLDASKYNILDFFKTPNDLILLNENNNNNQINNLNKKFKKVLENYKSKYGDLTSLLKIFIDGYKIFDKTGHVFSDKLNNFFYTNFLNQDLWFKAFNNYDKLHKMFRFRFNHIYILPDIANNSDIGARINSCFYYTFYNNLCSLNNNLYEYKNIKLNLSQYSFNYSNQSLPKELFFIQLVNNSNKYEISITGKITDSIFKIVKLLEKHI